MTDKHSLSIGVLALQGAVHPHKDHIEAAGGVFKPVKTQKDFDSVDAFILPGGESTTMIKLIDTFGLWNALSKQFQSKPVWGICAGAILLAETVRNPEQKSFGCLPITIERNGYGRQLESFHDTVNEYPVSFIRAPVITQTGKDVEVLAQKDESPIWVRYKNIMLTTFHPELTRNVPSPMHETFIEMIS